MTKKIYLKGHGFLWDRSCANHQALAEEQVNFMLLADLVVYVEPGNLLDGIGIANLIDKGTYGWHVVQEAPAKAPAAQVNSIADIRKAFQEKANALKPPPAEKLQIVKKAGKEDDARPAAPVLADGLVQGNTFKLNRFLKGTGFREHFLVTDEESTKEDLEQETRHEHAFNARCQKYLDAKKDGTKRCVFGGADGTFGSLLRLNRDEFIYFTHKNFLTPLSVIQHFVNVYLLTIGAGTDYELHWVACRQPATGRTYGEVLKHLQADRHGPTVEKLAFLMSGQKPMTMTTAAA